MGDPTTPRPNAPATVLTQRDLDQLRGLVQTAEYVPVWLVRRLLDDREQWVKRAFEARALRGDHA